MKRRTFLGRGVPPMADRCASPTCKTVLLIHADCYVHELGYGDQLFCSVDGYAKHNPSDPDARKHRARPSNVDARPADDATDSW